MSSSPVVQAEPAAEQLEPAAEPALVEQDLLVEDVSIDGMCGVY
jgi:mycofactocin precursor